MVALAYHHDAVITICRQKKGTLGGAMTLVLAPSTGCTAAWGSEPAPTQRDKCSEGCKADRVGAKCWDVGVSSPWSCCAVRWCHRSRCTLRDICLSDRVSCISQAIDSVVSSQRDLRVCFRRILTLAAFDTMVDSPSPACQKSVRKTLSLRWRTVLTMMGRSENNSWGYAVYDECRNAASIKK